MKINNLKNFTGFVQIIFLIIVLSGISLSGQIKDSTAKQFIESLLSNSADIEKFLDKTELTISKRLGISYREITHKFLISNDIDPLLKKEIAASKLNYKWHIEDLKNNYSKIVFTIDKQKSNREYYFHNSELISKPYFLSRDWKSFSSRFFIFHISDSTLFNKYSAERLDEFVTKTLQTMSFNNSEIEKLGKEKIHYFLCRDENEIELLTGYKARGLYYLPYDYIITTFSCHYHELMHLLMNYKIKENDLYTLPFLQEGFAVAYGGRGGKEPGVILEMGCFLAVNNFIDYQSLLSKSDFYQFDASMSYPIAGLFTKYFIESSGFNSFLDVYKKYSGSQYQIDNFRISINELPHADSWIDFAKKYYSNPLIKIDGIKSEDFSLLKENEDYSISESDDLYLFKLKNRIDITSDTPQPGYKSKLFSELFPGEIYKNQNYTIVADSNEISVYNFLTNNLEAKYARGFSIENKAVPEISNEYVFCLSKNIFYKHLKNYSITSFPKLIE